MLTCHLFTHFSESGSRRGRPPGSTNKRKLSDDPSALKLSKKAKLSEDDEDSPATPEQVKTAFICNFVVWMHA